MALQLIQLPITTSSSQSHPILLHRHRRSQLLDSPLRVSFRHRHRGGAVSVGGEETELRVSPPLVEQGDVEEEDEDEEEDVPPTPEDLEYVSEIQRVLELLKKNRDMLFSEVKLTIMIEDPREVERRRLLGIEDLDTPTREDLGDALEEVKEGKVPRNRAALRLLAEEMINWPNLEVEIKKSKRGKSLYAKATDTGVAPEVAAKRLNIDWDSAAEIDDADVSAESQVPAALGYGALYLVSAFPVIIGISVVLILFYNSLQAKRKTWKSLAGQLGTMVLPAADFTNKMAGRDLSNPGEQVSVSVKKAYPGEVSLNFMVDPAVTAQLHPPPFLPANPKFLSGSLPNSASSSPRFSSSLFRKKQKPERQASPMPKRESQGSPQYVDKLQQHRSGSLLWRSKSCSDGRASAVHDEFNLPRDENKPNDQREGSKNSHRSVDLDKEFKCGSLCLFLPGLGKAKPVKPRKEGALEGEQAVSRTVSMEKFECGSWASSAIMTDNEVDGDSKNLYFDLPMELIKGGVSEPSSPVTAAFIFDKERKGVLKNVNTKGTARKSHDSARHVRFSVSSPSSSPGSCITPRLVKAREDFNAYLEAQSA